MSNMSYCRFENTAIDLRDGLYNINEDLKELSDTEKFSRKDLISLCEQILQEAN